MDCPILLHFFLSFINSSILFLGLSFVQIICIRGFEFYGSLFGIRDGSWRSWEFSTFAFPALIPCAIRMWLDMYLLHLNFWLQSWTSHSTFLSVSWWTSSMWLLILLLFMTLEQISQAAFGGGDFRLDLWLLFVSFVGAPVKTTDNSGWFNFMPQRSDFSGISRLFMSSSNWLKIPSFWGTITSSE